MDVMFYCLREATSTYDVHIGFNYVWPVRWSVPWVLKEKKIGYLWNEALEERKKYK